MNDIMLFVSNFPLDGVKIHDVRPPFISDMSHVVMFSVLYMDVRLLDK